ncbi:MAG: MgtC/SapB family protein [Candidatus Promineifilaceae bacterium]|nr:MgtC/SapB family protein [Candidatus Promineifilaceae bacterium]
MIELPTGLDQLLRADFVKLTIAFLLTFPIAYDRERNTQIMGLRTFPLVALATCSYVLISLTIVDNNSSEVQARIIQGVITGIGFIGGGAILKREEKVLGTASAASIWTTGAIGLAAAYARYDIAVFLAIANFFILRSLTRLKSELAKHEVADGQDSEQTE